MKRRFLILDAEVVLDGPDEVVAPVVYAYGRFLAPGDAGAGAGAGAITIVARGDRIEVNGRGFPRAPGADPTLDVYQYFLDATLARVASHAVLHAGAVVDEAGAALIVAGPSGHGKSSLTQALVAGGRRFLSDDYAPLDLHAHTVAPYPRTLGLLLEGAARTPEAFAAAARSADAPRLFGKVLVDVGRALGEGAMAVEPAPLRYVVLLTTDDRDEIPPPATRVELTCLSPATGELLEQLRKIPGVVTETPVERGELTGIAMRLDPAARPTAALSRIAANEAVLFCQKYWEETPDFAGEPRLTPVRRRLAAEFLGRELLNRTPAGRLLGRYGGDVTALFLDLASALRNAECYRLRVGRFEATVELVSRLAD